MGGSDRQILCEFKQPALPSSSRTERDRETERQRERGGERGRERGEREREK